MSTRKLLPCPFCGKDVAELTNAHTLEKCGNFDDNICSCNHYTDPDLTDCPYITVVCDVNKGGCGATCGFCGDKETAADRWNRRETHVTSGIPSGGGN